MSDKDYPVVGPLSVASMLFAYEDGELDEEETIALFQHLVEIGRAHV